MFPFPVFDKGTKKKKHKSALEELKLSVEESLTARGSVAKATDGQ